MFDHLIDENDLEFTEHRLRVEVMSLKRAENVDGLFRLYGVLARVLARRGDPMKAQDALNDQEYLLVEHKWRGTQQEIWCHYDRALAFQEMGRPEISRRNLGAAEKLLQAERDEELKSLIEKAKLELESMD